MKWDIVIDSWWMLWLRIIPVCQHSATTLSPEYSRVTVKHRWPNRAALSLAFIDIMSRLLPLGDNYTSRQWTMWEELWISDEKGCKWSFTRQAGPPAEGLEPFPCHDWHVGQGLGGNLMQIGWPPTCLISSGGNTNRPIWPGPSYTHTGNMFSFSPLPSSHT